MNARARKPLEPGLPTNDAERTLRDAVTSLLATQVPRANAAIRTPNPEAIEAVAASIASAERGLIVYGPSSSDAASHRQALFDLASWTGFPVLAEATSQMRLGQVPEGVVVCDAFDLVLKCAAFRAGPAPDLVLQFGDTPTSGAWEAYARFDASRTERVVLHPHAWLDPQGSASRVVFGETGLSIAALLGASRRGERVTSAARDAWRARFVAADRAAASVIDDDLASEAELGEGKAVRTLARALPDGSILVAGNSLPVRHLDLFAQRSARDVRVLCQRGANGIDGMVAGTAGVARALGLPTALLIGDVSLFHDVSSLSLLAGATEPVVVVLLHNHGGRIFEQLSLGAMADKTRNEARSVAVETLKHIVTRNEFAFEHAARFAGIEYAVAGDEGTLQRALEAAFARRGGTLIEVTVPEHGAAAQARRLLTRLEERSSKIFSS